MTDVKLASEMLLDLRAESSLAANESLNGISVLLLTSGHDVTDHRIYGKLACSLEKMGAEVTIVGMIHHKLPIKVHIVSVPQTSSRLVRFLCQPLRCLVASRRLKVDIVHFHDAEFLPWIPIARRLWRKRKFVYDVHEDFANLLMVRDWLPPILKRAAHDITDFLEKKLARTVDAIVGVTPPLTDKFAHKNRITACNFITNDFVAKAMQEFRELRQREFDLIHMGTLSSNRALFLAATLGEFHRLRPGARSLILGVTPEIYRQLQPQLPENCLVLGKIPHDEMPEFLGNAKIGLSVHPWLGPHLEVAFPVKVSEYMISGCGVVSSALPVLNRILSQANPPLRFVKLISGGTPQNYAHAALELIGEIETFEHPEREVRRFVLHHMLWDHEAKKIRDLYLRLLN